MSEDIKTFDIPIARTSKTFYNESGFTKMLVYSALLK